MNIPSPKAPNLIVICSHNAAWRRVRNLLADYWTPVCESREFAAWRKRALPLVGIPIAEIGDENRRHLRERALELTIKAGSNPCLVDLSGTEDAELAQLCLSTFPNSQVVSVTSDFLTTLQNLLAQFGWDAIGADSANSGGYRLAEIYDEWQESIQQIKRIRADLSGSVDIDLSWENISHQKRFVTQLEKLGMPKRESRSYYKEMQLPNIERMMALTMLLTACPELQPREHALAGALRKARVGAGWSMDVRDGLASFRRWVRRHEYQPDVGAGRGSSLEEDFRNTSDLVRSLDNRISKKDKELVGRNKVVRDMRQEVARRDKVLKDLKSEHKLEKESLRNELQSKERKLAAMYRSASWKVSAPVRLIGRILRAVRLR